MQGKPEESLHFKMARTLPECLASGTPKTTVIEKGIEEINGETLIGPMLGLGVPGMR